MLNIEILEVGKNVTTGSGVLKVLQNSHSPIADLFVRESIQNSLDAGNEQGSFVNVRFIVDNFNNHDFSDNLEKIGPILKEKYKKEESFLAIRDSGTIGLTGPLSHDDMNGQNFGNLLKLVYDLAKPQEKQGAGGSWGYGKTIFYRMGIGLVIYYSRIKLPSGKYQERLAVAMVEDEGLDDAIIPPYKGDTRSGVAWWGERTTTNSTEPITDSEEIEKILSIFNLETYYGKETGTTVIIPYINEKKILQHNEIEAKNGKTTSTIYDSLIDYLKISVQRWYAPRLNNHQYSYNKKKYLRVKFNNDDLDSHDQDPYFRVLLDMYNYAITDNEKAISYIDDRKKLLRETIFINSSSDAALDERNVGTLVFGVFNYQELGMSRSNSPLNPHFLSNIELTANDINSTIVTFCRQPGMLVDYVDKGDWAHNLPSKNEGEYIIALFVLNSNNKIRFNNDKYVPLEEYIRKGEEADHIRWEDHQSYGVNPKIVSRIQSNVISKLRQAFDELVKEKPMDNDSRLSRRAGDLILPENNFGNKARKIPTKKRENAGLSRNTSHCKTTIFNDKIKYKKDGIEIPIQFQVLNSNLKTIYVDLEIKQESSSLSIDKLEKEIDKPSPISIGKLNLVSNDSTYIFDEKNIDKEISLSRTNFGTVYQVHLSKSFSVGEILLGTIFISGTSKEFVPVLRLKSAKGE